jgi:hypothetical protein
MRGAIVLAVLLLAGCGAADAPKPRPAAKGKPREIVYMSRNSWDAVPEDIAVYEDGRVDYRQLLHTKINMKVRTLRLTAPQLADLRRMIASTRLRGADHPGATQPRDGFRYLLRIDGRSISTVDGRIAPGVRPLVRRLARLEDKLLFRGE